MSIYREKPQIVTHNNKLAPVNDEFYHPWINKLVQKLNDGLAPTIAIVGKQGNGKSYTAVKLAEILYDEINVFEGDFEPSRNLCYTPLEFVEIFQDIEVPVPRDEDGIVQVDEMEDINPKREMIILDEAATNLNVLDHHDSFNRSVDELLQTQRFMNCVTVFITPKIGSLDSRVRQEVDFMIEMVDQGLGKPYGLSFQHANLGSNSDRRFIPYYALGYWKVEEINDEQKMWGDYKTKELDDMKLGHADRLAEELKESEEEDKVFDANELLNDS